jgi:hypothetical protein
MRTIASVEVSEPLTGQTRLNKHGWRWRVEGQNETTGVSGRVSVYRPFVENGGLMMYGPDTADIFRRAAAYVDRVLNGEKPADLPVQQPNKFEFVINLKTAKTLGIAVPPALQAAADEVIE